MNLTSALMLAVLLSSCTEKNPGGNVPQDVTDPRRSTVGAVPEYSLADEPCQSRNEETAVRSFASHQWKDGRSMPIGVRTSRIISSNSLRSLAVKSTFYGYRQVEECMKDDRGTVCQAPKVKSPGKPLRICQSEPDFPAESLEGIALTSLHHLDHARKFYSEIPEARRNLPEAQLVIAPDFKKKIMKADGQDETRTLVDNLSYNPSWKGSPSFLVFPSTDVSEETGESVRLWESPWGVSHEFGHHILMNHSLSSFLGTLDEEIWHADPGLVVGLNPIESLAGNYPGFLQSRSVNALTHWQPVSEAFADLYAFYANGQRSRLAKGLPCLETSRDTASSVFHSGAPKMIDREAAKAFFSREAIPRGSCGEPDFQSAHSVGAIIAYGMNRVFSKSVRTRGNRVLQSSSLLIRWSDGMRNLLESRSGGYTIVDLIAVGLATAARSGRYLTSEQCAAVSEVFPAWKSELLRRARVACLK